MDIGRLDTFEGMQYTRKIVKVKILDKNGEETGEEKEAATYEWTAGRGDLEDQEWDFQHFVKEKLSAWAGGRKQFEGEIYSAGNIICLFFTNFWAV